MAKSNDTSGTKGFGDYSQDERKAMQIAMRHVDTLVEAEVVARAAGTHADEIQQDLLTRGVKDAGILKEAREAVIEAARAGKQLRGEVREYRKLLGARADGGRAVSDYAKLLRGAHAGDMDAMTKVQNVRQELTEAIDAQARSRSVKPAAAQEDSPKLRYEVRTLDVGADVMTPRPLLATNSASEAFDAFNGRRDHQVVDLETRKLVAWDAVDERTNTPTWKTSAGFGKLVASERARTTSIAEPDRTEIANTIESGDAQQLPVAMRSRQYHPALELSPSENTVEMGGGRQQRLATSKAQQETATPGAPERRVDRAAAYPPGFEDKYRKVGDRIVDARNEEHVVLIDKGTKLHIPHEFDADSVRAAVDVSEARGWSSMKVSGSERFRQAVYLEAATRGIVVEGYKPTDAERSWAEQQAIRRGASNTVREHDPAKAFEKARTPEERRAAVAEHPQLQKAFKLQDAYVRLARGISPPAAQEAFVDRMRKHIASDVAEGRPLPHLEQNQRPFWKRKPQDDEQVQVQSTSSTSRRR